MVECRLIYISQIFPFASAKVKLKQNIMTSVLTTVFEPKENEVQKVVACHYYDKAKPISLHVLV